MKELFTINNKNIYNIDTTILYTSEFNYNSDAIELLNQGCTVISKNSHIDISDIKEEFFTIFDCLYLQNKKYLTKEDEYKINILGSISSVQNTVVFLNILIYTDNLFKEKVINYLKEKNIRIINYTTEIEETLMLPYLVVINQNKIVMEGETKEVLKVEDILKKLGFNLPFIVELSSGLKLYGLIDKIYYNKESLVDDLWK